MSKANYENLKKEILMLSHPIGSPYITQENINPSTILGFGEWERVKGKVLVGLDEDDEYFNEIGKEGGEKEHTQTVEEMPEHYHYSGINMDTSGFAVNGIRWGNGSAKKYLNSSTGGTNASGYNGCGAKSSSTGEGKAMNVMNPYRVVGYMWVRIA